MPNAPFIAILDKDVVFTIFTMILSTRRLNACSLVCKAWNRVLDSKMFWKQMSHIQAKLHPYDIYTHLLIVFSLDGSEARLPLILPRSHDCLEDIHNARITNDYCETWSIYPSNEIWKFWFEHLMKLDGVDLQIFVLDVYENLHDLTYYDVQCELESCFENDTMKIMTHINTSSSRYNYIEDSTFTFSIYERSAQLKLMVNEFPYPYPDKNQHEHESIWTMLAEACNEGGHDMIEYTYNEYKEQIAESLGSSR